MLRYRTNSMNEQRGCSEVTLFGSNAPQIAAFWHTFRLFAPRHGFTVRWTMRRPSRHRHNVYSGRSGCHNAERVVVQPSSLDIITEGLLVSLPASAPWCIHPRGHWLLATWHADQHPDVFKRLALNLVVWTTLRRNSTILILSIHANSRRSTIMDVLLQRIYNIMKII